MIDPNHTYVFRTGEYGIYDYWYKDLKNNYWKYTNAPEDHADYDPNSGVPLLVKAQPMPSTAPGFFTIEGYKRHISVSPEFTPIRNGAYSPTSADNIWFEVFEANGVKRFVYLDTDIKENIDLWVQYQLRITDSSLINYRKFYYDLFNNRKHPKDRVVGVILMLVDQALFSPEELVAASVGDLSFIDNTIKLCGRKFVCDPVLLDFFTSIHGGRDKSSPLFKVDTVHGSEFIGIKYIYSLFHYLRVSPFFLLSLHASNLFSKIATRLSTQGIEDIEGAAFSELKRIFSSNDDVVYLVDNRVRKTIEENINKGMSRVVNDDYATLVVSSDLDGKTPDEEEFSEWLHNTPMHELDDSQNEIIDSTIEEHKDQLNDAEEHGGSQNAMDNSKGVVS